MNERGSIATISLVMLVLILGVIAVVVNTSYTNLVRAELQAAADAVAHAGAKELCSTTECWENAIQSAVSIMNNHAARGNILDDNRFNIDVQGGPIWDYRNDKNLFISIERGMFSKRNGFTSFEGKWDFEYPGMPSHALANAVQVSISRPAVEVMGNLMGMGALNVTVSATAIAGPISPRCVVPFAIPICHVLNRSGSVKDICKHDRIFTRADRYCDAKTGDCDARPSFPYEICNGPSDDTLHRYFTESYESYTKKVSSIFGFGGATPGLEEKKGTNDGPHCVTSHGLPFANPAQGPKSEEPGGLGFENKWYTAQHGVNTSDHFGVVGLPGETSISEVDIYSVLNGEKGCIDAQLGDPFRVLEAGLQNTATGDLIWSHIMDLIDPAPDADHPPFRDAALGTLEFNESVFVWNTSESQTLLREERGICNSRRFEPATEAQGIIGPNGNRLFKFSPAAGISDNSPVWQVYAPVVANPSENAESCEGLSGAVADPPNSEKQELRIVGFVKVNLFDTDIGVPSPSEPGHPDVPLEDVGAWGFRSGVGPTSDQCNLVRGRVSCESSFIPTSDANRKLPRLIEKSLKE